MCRGKKRKKITSSKNLRLPYSYCKVLLVAAFHVSWCVSIRSRSFTRARPRGKRATRPDHEMPSDWSYRHRTMFPSRYKYASFPSYFAVLHLSLSFSFSPTLSICLSLFLSLPLFLSLSLSLTHLCTRSTRDWLAHISDVLSLRKTRVHTCVFVCMCICACARARVRKREKERERRRRGTCMHIGVYVRLFHIFGIRISFRIQSYKLYIDTRFIFTSYIYII